MYSIKLHNLDGTDFNIKDYQGDDKLLVIFFRGAWCNVCKKQLQDMENNMKSFTEKGIKLLAIASDSKFKLSLLKNFLKLTFPVISDPKMEAIDKFQLRTTYKDQETSKPAVFLFDKDENLLFNYIGDDYDDRMSAKNLLKEIN